MLEFDKLQKIMLQGQEKIISNPLESNIHRLNLFKKLIKILISNSNKYQKNKLILNFDTGEPYYKKIQHNLDSRNRFRVSLAQIKPDLGISFNEMNFIQRLCVMYILQLLLSQEIFYNFLIVMLQQNVLGEFADIKYWAKDKDEISQVIASYNPNKKAIDNKILDTDHQDSITKHAYKRSQGNYWSYIFLNKNLSKIGFAFSGHHVNINYNFYIKNNKVEIECMPFFIGSAPIIIPKFLKKDVKKITCKKYDRTLGFWYAMSGMTTTNKLFYFNSLINSIKDSNKYKIILDKSSKIIGEKNLFKIGGHNAAGSSMLDGFIDTCDSNCYNNNIKSLNYSLMNIQTKNIVKSIINNLQNYLSFKNIKNFTINNLLKDINSFNFSWAGNKIQSIKSKKDPILYVRLQGNIYTIEYLISNEYTIAPYTTDSLYTHEHLILRYTDSHFPYKRAFDNQKPYYLQKKITKKNKKYIKNNKSIKKS